MIALATIAVPVEHIGDDELFENALRDAKDRLERLYQFYMKQPLELRKRLNNRCCEFKFSPVGVEGGYIVNKPA